jgi:tRNA uridine 5-carboxymethylaminomethyl modification enzyme
MERVRNTYIGNTEEVQTLLAQYKSTALPSGVSLTELIRRPELSYEILKPLDKERPQLPKDVQEEVNINLKYEGYIKRQKKQVEQFHKLEKRKIPPEMDYHNITSLRLEAIQKLSDIRPKSVGQAARISGVSPSDISVLLVYLETFYKGEKS